MNISLPPEYWGKSFWNMMYSVAYTYPSKPTQTQKNAAISFYSSLRKLIPCESCREHYTKLLSQSPIHNNILSRTTLMKWVERISNAINTDLGKPLVDHQAVYAEMDKVKIESEPVEPQPKPQEIIQQNRGAINLQRNIRNKNTRISATRRTVTRTNAAPRQVARARTVSRKPCGCGKKKATVAQ